MNLKTKTLERFNYFIGRACSVHTSQGRTLVIVDSVDCDGLWGANPEHHTLVFFMMEHIIKITEEVMLDPSIPEHAQMIEKYEKPLPPPTQEPELDEEVTFVDIQSITKLAHQTKAIYQNAPS